MGDTGTRAALETKAGAVERINSASGDASLTRNCRDDLEDQSTHEARWMRQHWREES